MEKILEILERVRPGADFSRSENIWKEGLIDSVDIISIVSQLEEIYSIEIGVEDIIVENFSSVAAIDKLVKQLLS